MSGCVDASVATCTGSSWDVQTCDPNACAASFTTEFMVAKDTANTASGSLPSCPLTRCVQFVLFLSQLVRSACSFALHICNLVMFVCVCVPTGQVTFTCASGYIASGPATCTAGQWNSPTCQVPSVCLWCLVSRLRSCTLRFSVFCLVW